MLEKVKLFYPLEKSNICSKNISQIKDCKIFAKGKNFSNLRIIVEFFSEKELQIELIKP